MELQPQSTTWMWRKIKKNGQAAQTCSLKVYVAVQQSRTCRRHLSWSCWTTSPVRVMVCRSYSGCCCCLVLPESAWVSGWTMDMWTFRLCAFSKRFPQMRQANSRSASALCFVIWYFRDARWRHWKPHTSHLKENKSKSIQSMSSPDIHHFIPILTSLFFYPRLQWRSLVIKN